VVERLTEEKKNALGIPAQCENTGAWSVWECEPSSFDWHYDAEEVAYIFAGKVRVKTDEETVDIQAGDLVTFPVGLSCRWEIEETIRKVFIFR
jgi:hypothetical protein